MSKTKLTADDIQGILDEATALLGKTVTYAKSSTVTEGEVVAYLLLNILAQVADRKPPNDTAVVVGGSQLVATAIVRANTVTVFVMTEGEYKAADNPLNVVKQLPN